MKIAKQAKILNVFITLLMLTIIACHSPRIVEPDEPVKDNSMLDDFTGNWVGATSQNETFTFKVRENKITTWRIRIATNSGIKDLFHANSVVPIAQSQFSIHWQQPGVALLINGEFKISSECEGSFNYNNVSGSWSLIKE